MIQMSHARVRAPQQPSVRRMVVVMMTGRHDLRSSYACRPGRGARYDIDDGRVRIWEGRCCVLDTLKRSKV